MEWLRYRSDFCYACGRGRDNGVHGTDLHGNFVPVEERDELCAPNGHYYYWWCDECTTANSPVEEAWNGAILPAELWMATASETPVGGFVLVS